jgi:SAM-dependent methyltransferase
MASSPVYDRIGIGYAAMRRPDPRIARDIAAALGDARSVVNVGAGSGSYEPGDRPVVAVEPSLQMVRQRPRDAAPVVRGVAEHLPFADGAFDAALAVLTLHHWTDRAAGLAELVRVARHRVVLFTWDPTPRVGFWLTEAYLPAILEIDAPSFPTMIELAAHLGPIDVRPAPVPHDCVDGFLGAYWRRPDALLDPDVRRGISCFGQLPADVVDEGVSRLAADLESGAWDARFGHLRGETSADLGYRIVVA